MIILRMFIFFIIEANCLELSSLPSGGFLLVTPGLTRPGSGNSLLLASSYFALWFAQAAGPRGPSSPISAALTWALNYFREAARCRKVGRARIGNPARTADAERNTIRQRSSHADRKSGTRKPSRAEII